MKRLMMLFVLTIVSLIWIGSAAALPSLQLDASPSIYNDGDETVYATSDPFTLYALANPEAGDGPGSGPGFSEDDRLYLSAALVLLQDGVWKGIEEGALNLGHITIDGVDIDVTGGMDYGTPPLDAYLNLNGNQGQLGPHGIYSTYFKEIAFTVPDQKAIPYNTQDSPDGLESWAAGDFLYYEDFEVSLENLTADLPYTIHFDLYSKTTTTDKDGNVIEVIDRFAPFSHDAQGPGDPGDNPVPEPATVVLLGFGLIGLAAVGRRQMKK